MNICRLKYRIGASSFYFIQGFSVTTWVSRLPDIKSSMSLSDASLGLLLLAPPAGQLMAMALSGWLVKTFGSARIVRIAALLLSGWLPVLGMLSNWIGLAAALFFFGMATNLSNIAVNTQCVGVERIYGKSIMASFHGIWSLAGICAILLSSFCAVRQISPAMNFLYAAVLLTGVFLLSFRNLLQRDHHSANEQKRNMKFRDLMKESRLWILGIISLGCLGCEGVMNNWTSIYFQKNIASEAEYVRVGFLVYMLSITGCRFTADWFVRKWGGKSMIRLAGCLILSGMVLMISISSLIPAAIGCALVGIGVSSIVPICYGIAGKSNGIPVATAITMVASVGFLGFLLLPAAVGLISEWVGLKTALLTVGLISFLATQSIVLIGKSRNGSDGAD